jgi:hypothetical protein
MQRYGLFCLCRGPVDTGKINSMKILIVVLEFAMYSLELEIKSKKKIKFIYDPPTLFFSPQY